MIVFEILMSIILMVALVLASISDCKRSIIPNKLIAAAIGIMIPFDLVYYLLFARIYFSLFVSNLLATIIISFAFYVFRIWAAGDSKLNFVIGLGIPCGIFRYFDLGPVPDFVIIVFVFSIAFCYVVIESIVIGIKSKTLFSFSKHKVKVADILTSYLFAFAAMFLFNMIILLIPGSYILQGKYLLTAIDFVFLLLLFQIRSRISNKTFYCITGFMWIILLALHFLHVIQLDFRIDIKSWILVIIVMLVRMLADKYNYQEVPVEQLKERMIPAAISVFAFERSKISGLPKMMTEDLRSRLTEENIDAIKKWSRTKNGKPSIIVVRKLPFAIFLMAGTIVVYFIEVAALWRMI